MKIHKILNRNYSVRQIVPFIYFYKINKLLNEFTNKILILRKK